MQYTQIKEANLKEKERAIEKMKREREADIEAMKQYSMRMEQQEKLR